MRPLKKSWYKNHQPEYDPYDSAKDDLIKAIGDFCSYCERQGHFCALQVEHIRDKDTHPHRKFLWRNFLLACGNCNPTKTTKQVTGMYYPTVDNTFPIFNYKPTGEVGINSQHITLAADQLKAKNLLTLIGLDRTPNHPEYRPKDRRWSERQDHWRFAERYLNKYRSGKVDAETIVDFALSRGHWSIWMTVFEQELPVIQRLKTDFPGTRIFP